MLGGHSGEAKGHYWHSGSGPCFAISDCPQGSPWVIVTANSVFTHLQMLPLGHGSICPDPHHHRFLFILRRKHTDPLNLLRLVLWPRIWSMFIPVLFARGRYIYPAVVEHMSYMSFRSSCFTHGSVCVLMLLSLFIPLSPSPTVSTSPFSSSASPFLPYI